MALGADRLARLAQSADALLALPAEQRPAWLAAQADADADLLPHLQRLLDHSTAQEQASTITPTALRRLVADSLEASQTAAANDLVGPYRLLQLLGEGGMGVVWRAERADPADGKVQRQVALKLPFAHPGQRRWAQRFARERDLLARLEHPHIARLYDAGLTDAGQPWLAMALVDGQTITAHADARRLDLRARILLFMQVLSAVQYAHAQLVVHRDLKPSNIFVDAAGQVQLLDFGIALPLDDVAGSGGPLTEVGQALLTPDYAAPEQLLRAPASTTADVYSLAVVLFELLCGRRPFVPAQAGRAALEQAVLATDPARASRALQEQSDVQQVAARRSGRPETLARQLRGDLDNILAKALQREPALRYASAEAFAADLQRQLDGVAVLAHPASLGYRAAKFLRRNRIAVAAAAAVALALVAGTGLALWQAQLATRQAARARAVQDFLVGVFDAADPARSQGKDPTARELLARGTKDVHTRLADQPELRDAVLEALLRIELRLSDFAHARPLAQARRDSLQAQTGGRGPAYAQAVLALATVEEGLLHYEASLALVGQAQQALRDDRSPLPWSRSEPDEALVLDLAMAEATSLGMLQRGDEALRVLQDLVPRLTALKGPDNLDTLQARSRMAFNLARAGQLPRALAILVEVEPRLRLLPPAQAIEGASLRGEAGQVLWRAGALVPAVQALRQSIAEYDRLTGDPNPTGTALRRDLGLALTDAGDPAAALLAMAEHAQRSRALYGPADLKTAIAEQASVLPLLLLGRAQPAQALARRSLDEFNARLPADGASDAARAPEQRGMQRQSALALLLSGDATQARALLEEVSARELAAKTAAWRRAFTRSYLAGALRALGQPGQAAAVAEEAQALASSSSIFQARLLAAKAGLNQAMALADLGQHGPAQQAWDKALAGLQATLGDGQAGHPLWLTAQAVRAELLRAAGQDAAAAALARSARAGLLAQHQIELPLRLWLVF